MRKTGIVLSLAGLSILAFCFAAWAEPEVEQEAVDSHLHKFSRGVVNIGTAPLEIPKQMVRQAQKGSGVADQVAGYVTGTFTGLGWAGWRLTSGIVDIFTAPFCGNQEGLIRPEFITDEDEIDREDRE